MQVSVKGRASSVSLLQMATYSGLCVLVRLQAFRGRQQPFPLGLVELLRDPRLLKVGVGCYEDGKRLTRDCGLSLSCTVDLRHLALRQKCGPSSNRSERLPALPSEVEPLLLHFREAKVNNGLSLKSLAADLLNVGLDKSVELRCSDWEAEQLTLEQVHLRLHPGGSTCRGASLGDVSSLNAPCSRPR